MIVPLGNLKNDIRRWFGIFSPIHPRVIRRLHEGALRVEQVEGKALALATPGVFLERAHVKRALLQ